MPMNDRRLAAIMFTDIVGYTSLMADDEQIALDIVSKLRDLLQPIILNHRGQWLKEMGDGTLSSFSSATGAVQCAIEIQKQLKQDPSFKIRIGIHLGDVVFTETDVFGDGVNIAARIEPNAEPGGIAVSGSVYDTLSSKYFQTILLGEKTLKNVGRPLRLYAISNDGLPVGKAFAEPLASPSTITSETTSGTTAGKTSSRTTSAPLAPLLITPKTELKSRRFSLATLKSKPLVFSTTAIIGLVMVSFLNLQPRPIAINNQQGIPISAPPATEPVSSNSTGQSAEDLQLATANRIAIAGEKETTGTITLEKTTETAEVRPNSLNPNSAQHPKEISASSSDVNKADVKEEDALTEIVLSKPAFVSPTAPDLVIAPNSIPVQTLKTTEKPPAEVLESPVSN